MKEIESMLKNRRTGFLLTIVAVMCSLACGLAGVAAPPAGKGGGKGDSGGVRPAYQAPPEGTTPWQMFGQNGFNTGQSPYVGPVIGTQHAIITGHRLYSPAIAADGTIYATGLDHTDVLAAHPDGTLKWSFAMDGDGKGTPAIGSDGVLYFIIALKTIVALDTNTFDPATEVDQETGRLRPDAASVLFRKTLSSEIVGSLTLHEAQGRILASTWDGYLYAVSTRADDGTLGTVDFQADLRDVFRGFGASTPAVDPDLEVYYVTSGDAGALHAINFDGSTRWTNSEMRGAVTGPAVGLDGTIYVTSQDDYSLWAVNPDGSVKWKSSFSKKGGTFANIVGFPALDEFLDAEGTLWTTIYAGAENGLYAFSGSGKLLWTFETNEGVEAPPAVGADGIVYIQPQAEGLCALTPDGMLLWSHATVGGHGLTPAIAADGTLYVGAHDPYGLHQNGGLHAFRDN